MDTRTATADRPIDTSCPLPNYQPIENYGLIGNMHTAALVGLNGSIDWLCLPDFDSPSIFAAILDRDKGGSFTISPVECNFKTKQLYWPDTNVLITRFFTSNGVAELIDFMPVLEKTKSSQEQQVIRILRVTRGHVKFNIHCAPAFNYGRTPHQTDIQPNGAVFTTEETTFHLSTSIPLTPGESKNSVWPEFTLKEQEVAVFSFGSIEANGSSDTCKEGYCESEAEHLFGQTVNFWQKWLSQCTYKGRWREMVHRSALTLKLLTYKPTGAIIVAPTCSLPEEMGGERNWDYRYTWIRDAAFTLYGFLRIGFTEEAREFMAWLENRCHNLTEGEALRQMYSIRGETRLDESTLDHWEGYEGSSPVRIGNQAYEQLQLDIYGALLDAVYLYNKYVSPISYDFWTYLEKMMDWLCDHWDQPDEGIWEVRGQRQHFVYSKLMCWVALDRALRLADRRSFPANRERWITTRDTIYQHIMKEGWNPDKKSFVQSYGSEALDASHLIMPLVFFLSPNDPRMLQTLEAIRSRPEDGGLLLNSLVYRYNLNETQDGLDGTEGTFNMCTFWLVEVLTRAGHLEPRFLEEARLIFEKMLGYSNHLGLYAEETGSHGEALGNFPQAFTHLSLISAAYNLDRALNRPTQVQSF